MTERTANQALATWAETEYETKQTWAKPSQSPRKALESARSQVSYILAKGLQVFRW